MLEDQGMGHGHVLACGPLTAVLKDGDLFDVRWRGVEIVQRMYVAVRDEAWNTIPATISNLRIQQTPGQATAEFDAHHVYGAIDFTWQGLITLNDSGALSFQMRGHALRDFRYCKIGFNIHHGLRSHGGRPFRCRTEQGTFEGRFEADLQPQLIRNGTLTAMTPHYDRIDISLDGAELAMEFRGDRFEMQDHRNWIDANWKSYGTPLEFGFPMDIEAGQELFQEVRLQASGPGVDPVSDQQVNLSWVGGGTGVLPRIGHLLRMDPDAGQLARLSELRPSHLRVDLHPGNDPGERLACAQTVAEALRAGLEVGVHLRTDHLTEDAESMADVLAHAASPVHRILVLAETSGFSAFRGACPPEASDVLIAALADRLPGTAVVSGTPQFFVDINRDRPDYSRISGIVFAANPQVHACDGRSIMQNPQSIPDVVQFARRLYGPIEVVLSPVDLLGFGGPFPAGPEPTGDRPANVDERQAAPFCAAWTVAALAAMAEAGVTAVTLFELVGPRGLMEEPSRPFDVFNLLTRIEARQDEPVTLVQSSDPDRVVALAFADSDGRDLFIANLTDESITVQLPDGSQGELAPYEVMQKRVNEPPDAVHREGKPA